MILQNITRAIREQNYYAVALEFVIVIAGVVIGFQITAWSEDRQDQAQEAAIIGRLSEEFSRTLQTAEARAEIAQTVAQSTQSRLERLAAENWPTEFDELASLVDATRAFPGPPETPSSFNELIASGDMNLIRDGELRKTLTDFAADHYFHTRDSQLSRDVALHLGKTYWDFSELVAAASSTRAPALQTKALEDVRQTDLIGSLAAIYRQQQEVARMQSETLEAIHAVLLSLEENAA